MNQFVPILLMILFASIGHQIVLYILAHEQDIIMRTFFTFVVQCQNFAMLIFSAITSIIDILIEILLFTLFEHALASIIDAIRLNLVRIKKVECVSNINNEATMFVSDFSQSAARHEIQFVWVAIYIVMQVIDGLLLIATAVTEFCVFVGRFILIVFNPADYSYKFLIIIDSKHNFICWLLTRMWCNLIDCCIILFTKKQEIEQENKA